MCTTEYINFVCSQLKGAGEIKKKKMSDDWCICINGKPIIFAFDNLSYVKMNPAIDDMMKSAWTGYPYAGAKEHYVLNIEKRDEAMKVVKRLLGLTQQPLNNNPFPARRAGKGS